MLNPTDDSAPTQKGDATKHMKRVVPIAMHMMHPSTWLCIPRQEGTLPMA